MARFRCLATGRPMAVASTPDEGGEIHRHGRCPRAAFFFCDSDAHAPWQRGSIEATDGVLRRSLPRRPRRRHG